MDKTLAHILVVEDEESIRDGLKAILELSGYRVSTAENGRLGFESIISEMPDLVLCDVTMPELNGFELLKTINQRLVRDNRIPPAFIFLTGLAESQEVRNGMNLGADDYILKPFESIDVINAIQLRLEKRDQLLHSEKETQKHPYSDKLALPCNNGIELISYGDIIRCEASRAYCTFYLNTNKKILVSKAMKEYEDALVSHNFFKVHKSNIVNLEHVKKYVRGRGGYLVLTDGSEVIVSVKRKENLLRVMTKGY